MKFTPHITVACVVHQANRFLCVREISRGQEVINQPAGHLEQDESLVQAALRETLEETGWQVTITHLIGIYLYQAANGVTYQRVCFAATPIKQMADAELSAEIIQPQWLTREELLELKPLWRSPLLLRTIDDFLAGSRYPLALLKGIVHHTDSYCD